MLLLETTFLTADEGLFVSAVARSSPPVGRVNGNWSCAADKLGIAGPRPLGWLGAEPGANGVTVDVSNH